MNNLPFGTGFGQGTFINQGRPANSQGSMFSPRLSNPANFSNQPNPLATSYPQGFGLGNNFAQVQPNSYLGMENNSGNFFAYDKPTAQVGNPSQLMSNLNANVPPWEMKQNSVRSSSRMGMTAASESFYHDPTAFENSRPLSRASLRPPSRSSTPRKSSAPIPKGHVYQHEGKKIEIRDVWADNLEEEFKKIRKAIIRYNNVAMDTEFPGVVARPQSSFNDPDYKYQALRCNVDLLNLIQLGVALSDNEGNLCTVDGEIYTCCWQFHFKFSLIDDMYAQDSIDMLKRSGINFQMHETNGIDIQDFGELLVSSGLVLLDSVNWIVFHGSYDFAYLLKVLTRRALPKDGEEFAKILNIFFPKIYDIKHIMEQDFNGGLSRLAEEVGAERIGPEHQAGSDALLTLLVFFKVKEKHFVDNAEELREKSGVLHGLGIGYPSLDNTPNGLSPSAEAAL